jgi:hypothetical protein
MSLKVEDITLLRRVFTWARANGWDKAVWVGWKRSSDGLRFGWDRGEICLYHAGYLRWVPVVSVREAVDVMVAKGLLPAEFSSAYDAGVRAARHRWDVR